MDLNLLRVFAAIYEEGSLSGAAERLCVTQPTVSHSCQKLRRLYGDPLFIRTGRGVSPTSFADGLYAEVADHLFALEATSAETASFSPSQARQAFVLCLSDLGESAFLPEVLTRLHHEAPGVTVQCLPVDIDTAAEKLSRGECDVVITSGKLKARTCSEVLHMDRYCLVYHPEAEVALAAGRYSEVPFVFGHPSLGHHPPVQGLLDMAGLNDIDYSTVQTFASLPYILSKFPGASVAPEMVVRQWRRLWPQLGVAPLPNAGWAPEIRLHRRQGPVSSALAWFCSFVLDVGRSVGEPLP